MIIEVVIDEVYNTLRTKYLIGFDYISIIDNDTLKIKSGIVDNVYLGFQDEYVKMTHNSMNKYEVSYANPNFFNLVYDSLINNKIIYKEPIKLIDINDMFIEYYKRECGDFLDDLEKRGLNVQFFNQDRIVLIAFDRLGRKSYSLMVDFKYGHIRSEGVKTHIDINFRYSDPKAFDIISTAIVKMVWSGN